LRSVEKNGKIVAGVHHLDDRANTGKDPCWRECSHPARLIIKVITLYQPDPALWVDDKVRRE